MFVYLRPKFLFIIILGIASALPAVLIASTLTVFLTEYGLERRYISIFGLASVPYALKFLWSPLVDNFKLPFLSDKIGYRKSWLLSLQLLLMSSIITIGFINPQTHIYYFGLLIFLTGFFAATQDIIIYAYRIEILENNEQGFGSAATIFGYRIGMLISGAGCLYLASYLDWHITYYLMGMLFILFALITLFANEPDIARDTVSKNIRQWLKAYFVEPFVEIFSRKNWAMILLLVLFYKLSDAYLGMMTLPFLLEIGFTKIEIANIVKIYGSIAILTGMFVGGYIVLQLSIARCLLLSIILQSISNLMFIMQAIVGNNPITLLLVISVENFVGGISSTVLVAYISNLVNKQFTATQYAILSSLAVFGRTTISASAGYAVEQLGWIIFFIFTALLSLPVLFCWYYVFYRKA